MSDCDARIRPFLSVTEIACEKRAGAHEQHEGTLHDYAYSGSRTTFSWFDTDRRTFHGEWPGRCEQLDGCVLPSAHPGNCAT